MYEEQALDYDMMNAGPEAGGAGAIAVADL